MDIMIILLDLMHVLNFRCQMVNEVKMLLFLEPTIVIPCMLIIEKKGILVLDEGPANELDDDVLARLINI